MKRGPVESNPPAEAPSEAENSPEMTHFSVALCNMNVRTQSSSTPPPGGPARSAWRRRSVIRFGGEEDDFFVVERLHSFKGSSPFLT
jgi:hypothetical protein